MRRDNTRRHATCHTAQLCSTATQHSYAQHREILLAFLNATHMGSYLSNYRQLATCGLSPIGDLRVRHFISASCSSSISHRQCIIINVDASSRRQSQTAHLEVHGFQRNLQRTIVSQHQYELCRACLPVHIRRLANLLKTATFNCR